MPPVSLARRLKIAYRPGDDRVEVEDRDRGSSDRDTIGPDSEARLIGTQRPEGSDDPQHSGAGYASVTLTVTTV